MTTTNSNVSQIAIAAATAPATPAEPAELRNAKKRLHIAISRNKRGSDERPAMGEDAATASACSWARRTLIRGFSIHTDREAFCAYLNELEADFRPADAKPEVNGAPRRPQRKVKARKPPVTVAQLEAALSKDDADVFQVARRYIAVIVNDRRLSDQDLSVLLTTIEGHIYTYNRSLVPDGSAVQEYETAGSEAVEWINIHVDKAKRGQNGKGKDRRSNRPRPTQHRVSSPPQGELKSERRDAEHKVPEMTELDRAKSAVSSLLVEVTKEQKRETPDEERVEKLTDTLVRALWSLKNISRSQYRAAKDDAENVAHGMLAKAADRKKRAEDSAKASTMLSPTQIQGKTKPKAKKADESGKGGRKNSGKGGRKAA